METKEIEVEEILDTKEEVAFKQIEPVEELNKEVIEPKREEEEILEEAKEETNPNNNISSLFEAFESTEETFKTYSVYILRQEDTIDTIMDKYKVTKEQLSEYNDLSNLEIGSKLVIPTTLDE